MTSATKMPRTMFQKIWDNHTVQSESGKQTVLYVDLHLVHEVTSAQAFEGLRLAGRKVRRPERTIATPDHNVPTSNRALPIADPIAKKQVDTLRNNCKESGIRLYDLNDVNQGIVHIIGPELGYTQPGMTIVCGDSHTATHGAFGALAFGIGTSEVEHVLATQTLLQYLPKTYELRVDGQLAPGVTAKDLILYLIGQLTTSGGTGYVLEYTGEVIRRLSMEERMTVCNMAIEGGARCGYINPDQVTFDYLKGRDFAPKGAEWEQAVAWWTSLRSDADAEYDDIVIFDAAEIAPTVTWGITPGQGIAVTESVPTPDSLTVEDRELAGEAYKYMDLAPGQPIQGTKIDVCFIGSCTNGRISDLREAAKVAKGRHVVDGVKAFVVPGSERVKQQAEQEGLDKIFEAAGFEWREAGCSMCLAMNPDKLQGRQISASSSNRNFKGRQGSSSGRTLLMSPAMVAAAAVTGTVTDVRAML